jgi:hypothetical protein
MGSVPKKSHLSREQLSELSALADGTLERGGRPKVESMIAASPNLRLLYERERRVVELLRTARETDRAPVRLRARLAAQRPSRSVVAHRRAGYSGAVAAVLAVAAVAVALVLPAGTPGAPTASEAALLAARGPSQPPPAPDPLDPAVKLAQRVGDAYFPNWASKLGWRASGQRTDRLDHRRVVTVYYQWRHDRVAYTIVGAPTLAQPAARVVELGGLELRALTVHGRVVVTWRRGRQTCVLSGSRVTARELERLAAWKPSA